MKRKATNSELRASELATLMLELAMLGITQRSLGRCVGVRVGDRVTYGETGDIRLMPPINEQARRTLVRASLRHARHGHLPGCNEFGLATEEIARVLERHDVGGSAQFVLDTYGEALAVMAAVTREGKGWTEEEAREVLEIAVRRAITPAAMQATTVPQHASHMAPTTQKAGRKFRRTATRQKRNPS